MEGPATVFALPRGRPRGEEGTPRGRSTERGRALFAGFWKANAPLVLPFCNVGWHVVRVSESLQLPKSDPVSGFLEVGRHKPWEGPVGVGVGNFFGQSRKFALHTGEVPKEGRLHFSNFFSGIQTSLEERSHLLWQIHVGLGSNGRAKTGQGNAKSNAPLFPSDP